MKKIILINQNVCSGMAFKSWGNLLFQQACPNKYIEPRRYLGRQSAGT